MYIGTFTIGSDITAGKLAVQRIRESEEKISLVFKNFHANFKVRAGGDVFFCMDGNKIDRLVRRTIQSGMRENKELKIIAKVPSVSGKIIAEFKKTLSLKVK